MASNSATLPAQAAKQSHYFEVKESSSPQPAVVLAGRLFFSLIFVFASLGHFSHREIAFAAQQGVPLASLAVPFSGVMALLGGLSVLLGYKAKWGAWLLIAFLLPVTLMLHQFWAVKDPMMAQMQMAMFLKNVSIMGGALLISQFGAGPLSLDALSQDARRSNG